MTPTQREAALRLAEYQEKLAFAVQAGGDSSGFDLMDTAALLRELAAEPQSEPVAWRSKTRINNDFDSNWCLTSTEPPQTPRTIAIEPLYIHPPQQRQPLTEDLLRRARNLLSHPASWRAELSNIEACSRLMVKIDKHLHDIRETP